MFKVWCNKGEECGNGFTTKILGHSVEVTADRFLNVTNSSLAEAVVPETCKSSLVVPVAKVPNTKKCSKFRPISTVPIYEKLVESVVKRQLTEDLRFNDVLCNAQSGSRGNQPVITNVCDDWYTEMDKGNSVVTVFLGLRRAFWNYKIDDEISQAENDTSNFFLKFIKKQYLFALFDTVFSIAVHCLDCVLISCV